MLLPFLHIFFFFIDTAPPEIYTLSLHDALPISYRKAAVAPPKTTAAPAVAEGVFHTLAHVRDPGRDRKSTRLNSSHANISYAVFCLKKKKNSNPLTLNTMDERGSPSRADELRRS